MPLKSRIAAIVAVGFATALFGFTIANRQTLAGMDLPARLRAAGVRLRLFVLQFLPPHMEEGEPSAHVGAHDGRFGTGLVKETGAEAEAAPAKSPNSLKPPFTHLRYPTCLKTRGRGCAQMRHVACC